MYYVDVKFIIMNDENDIISDNNDEIFSNDRNNNDGDHNF